LGGRPLSGGSPFEGSRGSVIRGLRYTWAKQVFVWAAGIDALRDACDLHRDDLMAGFSLRDSVRFDDWLRDTQDQVRRERAARDERP